MKKILIVIVLLGNVFSYQYTSAQTEVDSTYNNSHYRYRMEFFDKVPVRKKAIVFLGNSITEAGDWSDILPGWNVLNRGISGDITFGIIARLDEVLDRKPSKIFLLIGVNDLKREIPNELIIENYKKIVDHVKKKSPKTEIYLQSLLPLNDQLLIDPFKMVKTENINILNKALQEIAQSNDLEFIDLSNVLADENGQLKKEFTPDGIHLKPVAYIDWVQYLKDLKYL